MTGGGRRWDKPPRGAIQIQNFCRLARYFSFDTLVTFFGAYCKDEETGPRETTAARAETHPEPQQESKRNRKKKSPVPSGVNKRSSRASSSIPRKSTPQKNDQLSIVKRFSLSPEHVCAEYHLVILDHEYRTHHLIEDLQGPALLFNIHLNAYFSCPLSHNFGLHC